MIAFSCKNNSNNANRNKLWKLHKQNLRENALEFTTNFTISLNIKKTVQQWPLVSATVFFVAFTAHFSFFFNFSAACWALFPFILTQLLCWFLDLCATFVRLFVYLYCFLRTLFAINEENCKMFKFYAHFGIVFFPQCFLYISASTFFA